MCTAATYCSGDFYFGRNLDYEFSYGEHVTIMPRNYPIRLHSGALDRHHAMIGMAHIQEWRIFRMTTRFIMTRLTKTGCASRG